MISRRIDKAVMALLLVAVLALWLAAPVVGQFSPQPEWRVTTSEATEPTWMCYGQFCASKIDSNVDVDQFWFAGVKDEVVWLVVQATADGMDPSLTVRDPMGNVIATNSCVNNCSFVEKLKLPETGTYSVALADLGANQTGNYTLQIERIPPLLNPPSLTYNGTIADRIDRGCDHDFAVFDAAAGSKVMLTVSAPDGMDPVVQVFDPAGAMVASKSCANACSLSITMDVALSGQHLIVISDSGLNEGGSYLLGLQCLFGACPPAPPSAWTNLGNALSGSTPGPILIGDGAMLPNDTVSLALAKGLPNASLVLASGLSRVDQPFAGGIVVPLPEVILPVVTDANGAYTMACQNWPSGIPAGVEIYVQAWQIDAAAPMGVAASNAVVALTP